MPILSRENLHIYKHSSFSNKTIDTITCVMPTSNDGSRLAIVALNWSTATYKKLREGLTADREFSAYLEKICIKFKSAVICRDLNIPEMDWKNHSFRNEKPEFKRSTNTLS